jgi:hypothetical protein
MREAIPGSPTAVIALLLAVPVTVAFFSSFPAYRAAFLSLLVGALLLPVGYGWELPGVTFLDKGTIPLLTGVAACLALAPGEFRYVRLRGLTLVLAVATFLGPMATAFTNADPYAMGTFQTPALTAWDGIGLFRTWAFAIVFPFLFGRMLFREVRQLEYVARTLTVAFLLYSIPMLWEVRMSPQLHNTVYGYFPHSFLQQMRDGGFRPVVFMGHGLALAISTSFAALASVMLWRRGRKIRQLPPPFVTFYLGAVVALCKTLAALMYAGVGGLIMFLAPARTQLRIAVVIACIVLAYPLLRTFDLFPTSVLTSLSGSASAERAQSLSFRFRNEDLLLAHARERWLFGWGGYGRNRVFDEEGNDTTVTDGLWIIVLGDVGAVGFASVFGLMLVPVFQCGRALKNVRSRSDRTLLASMALLVSLNWADSLPNALSGGSLMVFVTGAFAGVVEALQTPPRIRQERKREHVPAAEPLGPAASTR